MEKTREEQKARADILAAVRAYCDTYHKPCAWHEGARIPYAARVYDAEEMCALVDSALSFWLTAGEYTERFERELATYLGTRYCTLVNSGSSANLLAFMALTSPTLGERAILPGDEVITVAAGFPTTVAPIVQYGAIPVFVDVTLGTYNIDVSMLEAALSEKTRAVMVAHTLGNPFDIKTVRNFCNKYDLWMIEDNCDALGATYDFDGVTYFTGTVGDIGTSSFYPSHHMTTGEGGAVYTRDTTLHRIIRSMRDWGRDCVCPPGKDGVCAHRFDKQYGDLPEGYDHKYVYAQFGYNLKATDMQAAIGCAQLEKLPRFVARRRHNFDRLYRALLPLADKLVLPERAAGANPSPFGFPITVREGISREQVTAHLERCGVQTRLLFAGNLVSQPLFDRMRATGSGYRTVGALPVTDEIMRATFFVGVYPDMTDEMIDYVAGSIAEALR